MWLKKEKRENKIGWNVKVTFLKASHECLHFLLISLAFCSWHFPLGLKKKVKCFPLNKNESPTYFHVYQEQLKS